MANDPALPQDQPGIHAAIRQLRDEIRQQEQALRAKHALFERLQSMCVHRYPPGHGFCVHCGRDCG